MNELREVFDTVAAYESLNVARAQLAESVDRLTDQQLLDLLTACADLANEVDKIRVIGAGVAARRSARDLGRTGLAATRGHRTPSALVQSISGGTKADADRQVRLGTALLDAAPGPTNDDTRAVLPQRWDDPLRRGLLDSILTAAQHDAILRGLGEPPVRSGSEWEAALVVEAWTLAAEQLIAESATLPAEELLRRARTVRDALDPLGAEERFAQRFERRSFRMWIDAEGVHRASIGFDDEMAAWVQSMIDAALRPRRGGPRFVDSVDADEAARLAADPRTNEQLQYDLVMDVWRSGSLASAEEVFGARQPGVRMVVVADAAGPRDALGRLVATGHLEDRGDAVAGSVLDRALCSIGSVQVTVDTAGNPLDVGREQRLYTPRQRIALAVRDGGCMFPGCCVPASYCEAHHCDHWGEDHGRTDIDRGILLCRFHHLLLHANGWRITRHEKRPFRLHPPDGSPIDLTSSSAVKWAWDPPPDRAGWRTVADPPSVGAAA